MANIKISGLTLEYELLGPKTPRQSRSPRADVSRRTARGCPLSQALVAGGRRVLLWDRPNCGASDISFEAQSESDLQARTLIELIHALELGPTALAAGSGGSRVSLIAAARDPETVSHLIVWWISGGALSLISLAAYYCVNSAIAASRGGMAAVAELRVGRSKSSATHAIAASCSRKIPNVSSKPWSVGRWRICPQRHRPSRACRRRASRDCACRS